MESNETDSLVARCQACSLHYVWMRVPGKQNRTGLVEEEREQIGN